MLRFVPFLQFLIGADVSFIQYFKTLVLSIALYTETFLELRLHVNQKVTETRSCIEIADKDILDNLNHQQAGSSFIWYSVVRAPEEMRPEQS